MSAPETTEVSLWTAMWKSSSISVVKEVPATGANVNAVVLGAADAGTAPNIPATRAKTAPRAKPLRCFLLLDISLFLSWFRASLWGTTLRATNHQPSRRLETLYRSVATQRPKRYGSYEFFKLFLSREFRTIFCQRC